MSALEGLYREPLCGSLVFDIETGPQPWESIEKQVPPFVAPPHPGEFDPSTVKVGNLTEANAIKKIETKRAEHMAEVAAYEVAAAAARVAWEQKTVEGASLDASIGQVLAIGYRDARGNVGIDRCDQGPHNERRLIETFWKTFVAVVTHGNVMIGHYIGGFDIPFLIRRSWILGIDVPGLARDGKWLSRSFVDTRELWLCGERGGPGGGSSLDAVAKAMGVGSKEGQECSGATFWRYWQSGNEDLQRAALTYLANDLSMNAAIAERMGIL